MSELTFIGGLGAVAQRYGLEEAVLLHSCVFWWREHRAKRENFRDGRYWNHCSVKAFAELMPWWTAKQVRRIVESCRTQGALLTANYNERKDDKTLWYAPSDELLAYYGEAPEIADPEPGANAQMGAANAQMGKANAQMGKGANNRNTCNNPCSNPPIVPPEVKKALDDYAGEDRELREALDGLAENRARMKKPIKSMRAVRLLLAALDQLSGGVREIKIAMLDKAVRCNWLTVYALNKRDREEIERTRAAPERQEKPLKSVRIEIIDGEEVAVCE